MRGAKRFSPADLLLQGEAGLGAISGYQTAYVSDPPPTHAPLPQMTVWIERPTLLLWQKGMVTFCPTLLEVNKV